MQPLKLIIREPFFDTQLYMGRLYGWRADGSIATYDWNRLLESIIERSGPESRLPLECAFLRGDYLYGTQWDLLFRDQEIKRIILGRFERFASTPIEISQRELTSCLLGQQDSPMPFPHSDSIIFKKKLYTVSPCGLHAATCDKRTRKPISTRAQRAWDCPAFGLAKSRYWGMAIAAGEQGIFEFRPQHNEEPAPAGNSDATQQHRDCTVCEWMFFSLYGSSHVQPGFMLEYSHESTRRGRREEWETDDQRRRFIAARDADGIFETAGEAAYPERVVYSWGAHDKICRLTDQRIDVVKFNPWSANREHVFEPIGSLRVMPVKGGFVSAQTALFGFVVEFDRCLVVVDGGSLEPTNLWGEPVNWRLFRYSKFYANQLHVAYDDRLEVLSFNHDYFRDQTTKVAGYRYSAAAAT